MTMRRIIDISPVVSPALAVFPGDTPPSREVLLDLRRGDPLTLSTLKTTVHVGAHLDAPSHYGADAETIEALPLERALGVCEVVRVDALARARLSPGDLPGPPRAERLLIATGSYPDPSRFDEGFAALSPELVEWLDGFGVRLVGVDTPSVDLSDSKELPTHGACLAAGMTILEGLVLDAVTPGIYELVALPLRLEGFDASPVRAVLRDLA